MAKRTGYQNEVTTGEPLEKGGYFVAYNLVMRNAMKVFDLNAGEYACLTMLFSYAGADKDKCFPSQEALAEDLNLSDSRTVRKYLNNLQKKGAIDIYNRQNSRQFKITNVYDLSPCLNKIRDLYCSKEESSEDFGITMKKKSLNEGQDQTVLSEDTDSEHSEEKVRSSEFGVGDNTGQDQTVLSEAKDRIKQSEQIGSNSPTTINTIQLTYSNTNNKDYYDDDKRTSPSGEDSAARHNDDEINLIISSLREATKDELTDRSFKSVIRKVVNKYNQGKIGDGNFRDYLVTSLVNKIEELEDRRIKENAKNAIKQSKPKQDRRQEIESYEHNREIPLYNWLEE